MYRSEIVKIGPVPFPAFTGERVYMRGFTQSEGLPKDLERWQPTVDAMLRDVDAPGRIYLMVDQGHVEPGTSHRRPGKHVDGYWIEDLHCHGGGHVFSGWKSGPGPRPWQACNFDLPEALILASDVSASCVYLGQWEGEPGEGGDCEHIDTSHMQAHRLAEGIAYRGNVTMIHESLPISSHCDRTLVRLNVPGV